MARPRVFISSTHYDLKHVRSSLELFIAGMGLDAVLSEKGRIAYSPETPLDESCYREAETCDLFVLIVGGRYGSEASPRGATAAKRFYDRYDSITRKEYSAARNKGIPSYIMIERAVFAEYETYLRNKGNNEINYAHADSVNIFELIEDIISQPKNNPIYQFEKSSDIEGWLREQWSGLFRELLRRSQSFEQIAGLQAQVQQLSELNTTLKTYLEAVVSKVAPQESKALIETQDRRLDEVRVERELRENELAEFLMRDQALTFDRLKDAVLASESVAGFLHLLSLIPGVRDGIDEFADDENTIKGLRDDLNAMRAILGLMPIQGDDGVKPKTRRRSKSAATSQ